MFKKGTALAVLFALALASGVFAANSRTAPPAQAAPTDVFVISQKICFLIGTAFGGGAAIECAAPGSGNFRSETNVRNFANRLAGREIGDTTQATAADFKSIDLDLNQLHESDGELIVLLFVDDEQNVDVKVTEGQILPPGAGAGVGASWTCAVEAVGGDPDCVEGGAAGDGVIPFSIIPDNNMDRGPATLTIVQDRVPVDTTFTVVGEPDTITITALKTKLQGNLVFPTEDDPGTDEDESDDGNVADECRLAASASGFLAANGTPERTVLLGIVRDSDGTAISGSSVFWQTEDEDVANPATNFTPTIDLGAFGVGAPQIGCGFGAGTTTITATSVAVGPEGSPAVGIPVDPDAEEETAEVEMTVTGEPASMTLAATPATIACDGTATSTVSATVMDADGNLAPNGQEVRFDVQALGTANPIVAKTTDGIANSTITPLSAVARGVTVNVTTQGQSEDADLVANAIIVACTEGGAPGAPPPPAAGGGTGAGGGRPGGSISGPDTGSGGDLDGQAALPVWSAVALFVAAMALVGARFGLSRR